MTPPDRHEIAWEPAAEPCRLQDGVVHVWRIPLDGTLPVRDCWDVLSVPERMRALQFRRPGDRAGYVIAHGAMRAILAAYQGRSPAGLVFDTGASGKPALAAAEPGHHLEFNLSHSGGIALLAVARERAIGVDVQQWIADMDHLALAARWFSAHENTALRALSDSPHGVLEAFFTAWTRKEAYVKARGRGISSGLHHFDVSISPHDAAALLADRTCRDAPAHWALLTLPPGAGYSAAVAVARPIAGLRLFDASALRLARATDHAVHASAQP